MYSTIFNKCQIYFSLISMELFFLAEAELLAVVCSTTEVVATLDTSALTDVDVDTLYIGTDPTDTNCQGTVTEDGVKFSTLLEGCDSVVGVSNLLCYHHGVSINFGGGWGGGGQLERVNTRSQRLLI